MPDMRLIDANALDLVPDVHNAMNGVIFVNHPRCGGRTQMIVQQLLTRMISNAPTIDAVPVVHARWVKDTYNGRTCCSACKVDLPGVWYYNDEDEDENYEEIGSTPYCPNCGAKMDAKEG